MTAFCPLRSIRFAKDLHACSMAVKKEGGELDRARLERRQYARALPRGSGARFERRTRRDGHPVSLLFHDCR